MKQLLNDFQLTPHFNLREFQCRCCQQAKVWPQLPLCLEKLRTLWGKPLILTSGYRCPTHNKEVGGVPHSLHMKGCAADVVVMHKYQSHFCKLAEKTGFHTILPYGRRNFVHLAIKINQKRVRME